MKLLCSVPGCGKDATLRILGDEGAGCYCDAHGNEKMTFRNGVCEQFVASISQKENGVVTQ